MILSYKVKGIYKVTVKDATGKIKCEKFYENKILDGAVDDTLRPYTISTSGAAIPLSLYSKMYYLSLGNGTTPVEHTDTELNSLLLNVMRTSLTDTVIEDSDTPEKTKIVTEATYTVASTTSDRVLTEAGVRGHTTQKLLSRVLFVDSKGQPDPINLPAGESLVIEYQLTTYPVVNGSGKFAVSTVEGDTYEVDYTIKPANSVRYTRGGTTLYAKHRSYFVAEREDINTPLISAATFEGPITLSSLGTHVTADSISSTVATSTSLKYVYEPYVDGSGEINLSLVYTPTVISGSYLTQYLCGLAFGSPNSSDISTSEVLSSMLYAINFKPYIKTSSKYSTKVTFKFKLIYK